ncbi:DNA translocase FtsK [Ureibacillus sp. GCM10028918]|uniref:DNA translocase FtsK n=1 Tax=Ureibacillus sp. GCM10028918 TaxID=3273429 RepID=UPI00361DC1F5
MNWFKKQINKLFDNDIDDVEEYYEDEIIEEQISASIENVDGQIDEDIPNKRKSFKFPIIGDNEMESPLEANQSYHSQSLNQVFDSFEEKKKDTKYFYQPNAISKVFDVEVSGIRDLLEKRQRIKGHSNVINRQESTLIRRGDNIKKQDPIKKEFKNTTPIKKNVVEQEDELIPKRRFVPTQVPSPVYGFKKPSNIDHLLSKKHGKVGSKSNEMENDLEEIKATQDTKQSQHEHKVESTLSEVTLVTKEIISSAEISESNEDQILFDPVQKPEAKTTSFIDIEDELEEKPIVLKESEEKAVDFPILAESVDEGVVEEACSEEIIQPVKANLQSHAEQEAAVTVLDAVPAGTEILKVEKESDWVQVEEFKSSKLDLTNQQNEPQLEEILEEEQYVEEEKVIEDKAYHEEQVMSFEELQVDQAIHNNIKPDDIYPETEYSHESSLEPIQSTQVQRLVSIALDDSELESETEIQTNQEQERFAAVDLYNERQNQASVATEDYESKVDEISNPPSESEANPAEPTQSKGSKLPFNVLMLKSDKEKYAAKLAQKQMLQHNDDNKEMHRQITNTEEQHKIEHSLGTSHTESTVPTLKVDDKNDEDQTKVLQKDEELQDQMVLIQEGETVPLQTIEETPKEIAANNPEDKSFPKVYSKPSLDFLSPPEEKTEDREWLESQADVLVESLSYFQVTAQVESITQGPAVTQFEITVGQGTKVSKVRNLSDDLKLALAAKDIRIQAPIPGKSTIGIEIPNRISRAVQLSEVTCSDSFLESESPLEAALGLDLTGKPVTIDLRKMPHGLIAGATGSGKSVCINSILVSLLYKADPNELKLMLIDPKMVELAPFNHIPHLVSPVITDVKAATAALKWAVEEMERRYQLFAHVGVRDLPRYNKLADSKGEHGHKLPYILIVIDELADLMMMSPADVEEAICRIAQKARACGIHLIVATQRPSVDVITGLIKSNIPTRIAFAVSSQVDSRTILDSQGAERLLGRGDMLYLGNGMSAPIRLQGTFVTDDEIEEIIDHVRGQGEPDYFFQQDELLKKTEMVEEQDELFEEVCRFVHEQGSASTSSIQRKYHIGYNRAARLIDMLESQGYISEPRGSKPREVYITDSDLTSMFE